MTMTEMPAGSMPTDGRWGWYKDHDGQEFQRVSTLTKKVETDTYTLEMWRKRQVLIGAARRNDLVLAVKAMTPADNGEWSDRQRQELNKLVEKVEEAAKDVDGAVVGTAVHGLTERYDRGGEPLGSIVQGLPDQAERDLRAYAKLIELNGWRIVEVERTVVNDDLEVAGTFDRVYSIPGLTTMLGPSECQYGDSCPDAGLPGHSDSVTGDVKTEKSPMRNGLHIGPQLAIYSRARRMWVPSAGTVAARYVRAPCVRQDVGIVVHVRDGHAIPLLVDLHSGWGAALAARTQALREKAAKDWIVPLPNVIEPKAAEVATEVAVNRQYAAPDRPSQLVMPPVAVPATPPGGVEQVAVQRPDGMVSWQPSADLPVGTQVTVGGIGFTKIDTVENVVAHGVLDAVDKQAIENVWTAGKVEDLAETWRIYTQVVGRQWGGRVAEAADARRRQIECPQRSLHTGGGKCACGWTSGILA